MAASVVQVGTAQRVGGATSETIGLTGVVPGNCLVLLCGPFNVGLGATSVSGGGATWNLRASSRSTDENVEIWVGHNSTGGSVTIQYNVGSAGDIAVQLLEIGGVGTSDPFDVASTGNGNSTSPDSGNTASTAQADEIAIGAVTNGGSTTSIDPRAGDGYTAVAGFEDASGATLEGSYKILSGTGAQAARYTTGGSVPWRAAVVTLKAAGGGGATLRRYSLGLTGVG